MCACKQQRSAARCNVDLKANNDATALQFAQDQGHAGIAMIRNKRRKKCGEEGKIKRICDSLIVDT